MRITQRQPGPGGAGVHAVWWERGGPRVCVRQDALVVSEGDTDWLKKKRLFIARCLGGLRFMLASGLAGPRGSNGHVSTTLAA